MRGRRFAAWLLALWLPVCGPALADHAMPMVGDVARGLWHHGTEGGMPGLLDAELRENKARRNKREQLHDIDWPFKPPFGVTTHAHPVNDAYGVRAGIRSYPSEHSAHPESSPSKRRGKRGRPKLKTESAASAQATANCGLEESSDSWQANFLEMLKSKDKPEHPDSSLMYGKSSFTKLWVWAHRQRHLHLSRKLGKKREELLDHAGFVWQSKELEWEEQFNCVLLYKQRHGSTDIPILNNRTDVSEYPRLGQWVNVQRSLKRRGKLEREKIEALNGVGFVWEVHTKAWQTSFQKLILHKQKHGQCEMPSRDGDHKWLGQWIQTQRIAYARGSLMKDRTASLLALGLKLGAPSTFQVEGKTADQLQWEDRRNVLMLFKQHFGHCDVQQKYKDNSLAIWVNNQRDLFRGGRLGYARQNVLEAMGFTFEFQQSRWLNRYKELLVHKRNNTEWTGSLGSSFFKGKEPLARWARRQVRAANRGTLLGARIKLLQSLGINVRAQDKVWEARFQELQEYQKEYNDCNVAYGWAKSPRLGNWVFHQRILHKNGELPPERERKLREVGFVFSLGSASWEARYHDLEAFKDKYGHTNVPQEYMANLPLAHWVHNMRARRKDGRLGQERIKKLDQLGFCWNRTITSENEWMDRFNELCQYCQWFGNPHVPQAYKRNAALGRWVSSQRFRENNREGLLPHRRDMLLGLGFSFSISLLRKRSKSTTAREQFSPFIGRGRPPNPAHPLEVSSSHGVRRAADDRAQHVELMDNYGVVHRFAAHPTTHTAHRPRGRTPRTQSAKRWWASSGGENNSTEVHDLRSGQDNGGKDSFFTKISLRSSSGQGTAPLASEKRGRSRSQRGRATSPEPAPELSEESVPKDLGKRKPGRPRKQARM